MIQPQGVVYMFRGFSVFLQTVKCVGKKKEPKITRTLWKVVRYKKQNINNKKNDFKSIKNDGI